MAVILFADDNPVTLELMGQAARLLGHQALLVKSGKQVMEKVKTNHPEIIFLDMMMPDQNGLQVLGMLRKEPDTQDTPVFILSAGSSLDDERASLAAGATGYLSKPISLQTLIDLINRYQSS